MDDGCDMMSQKGFSHTDTDWGWQSWMYRWSQAGLMDMYMYIYGDADLVM